MEHCEANYLIKLGRRQPIGPAGFCQVSLEESGVGQVLLTGKLDQVVRSIYANKLALMAVLVQVCRQQSVSAPQVEYAGIGGEIADSPHHPGLEPLAGLRKIIGKGLVKLMIKLNQLLGNFGLHTCIIGDVTPIAR